ncbi:MAG: hypothetical protein LIP08_08420 [Bacteroides sp.]|nr:hypothetical protein [Bacteroides sp.]
MEVIIKQLRDMVSVYILTIKETNEKYYFTSLVAIFEAFDYDVLKIKYVSLRKHSFKRQPFDNKRIKIEKVTAFGKGDIAEKKNMNYFMLKNGVIE